MPIRLDILAWLLVPLAVTVVAVLWVNWRSRPKGPVDAHEAMADLARFRAAMTKPLPPRRRSTELDAAGDRSTRGAA